MSVEQLVPVSPLGRPTPLPFFRTLILPAGNRFISHLDLEAVPLNAPLGAASDAQWKKFWIDLQEFLDLMHGHYIEPKGISI
jgi:hypothetical protein